MSSMKEQNLDDYDDTSQESWEDSETSEGGKSTKAMLCSNSLNLTKDSKKRMNLGPGISELVLNFKSENAIKFPSKRLFSTQRYTPSFTNSSLNSFIQTPLTKVTSKLYFGSLEDAKNEAELRARKITHIISLIGSKHLIVGMSYKHSPMNDYGKTDLKRLFKQLWPFVEESQQPENSLFVHCMSGQNRSATLVTGILMKIQGKSLKEAFRMVKKKRPVVQINEQYAKQLWTMELELFGQTSVPEDWMEIRSADMETGIVVFSGDDMYSMSSILRTNRSTNRGSYNMNRIGEDETQPEN